jgi:hypothetical protein
MRSILKFKKTKEREIKERIASALRQLVTCIELLRGGLAPPGNLSCRG